MSQLRQLIAVPRGARTGRGPTVEGGVERSDMAGSGSDESDSTLGLRRCA